MIWYPNIAVIRLNLFASSIHSRGAAFWLKVRNFLTSIRSLCPWEPELCKKTRIKGFITFFLTLSWRDLLEKLVNHSLTAFSAKLTRIARKFVANRAMPNPGSYVVRPDAGCNRVAAFTTMCDLFFPVDSVQPKCTPAVKAAERIFRLRVLKSLKNSSFNWFITWQCATNSSTTEKHLLSFTARNVFNNMKCTVQ